MASDKDEEAESHSKMLPEQITGAQIGFAIVGVISICIILGLALPIFCPHAYEKLKAIVAMAMED